MTDIPASAPSGAPRLNHARLAARLVLFGMVLGVLGPFGSYLGLALPMRVLHYTTNMLVIGGLILAVSWAAGVFLFKGPVPFWASMVIALAMAPPAALIVMLHLWLLAPHILVHVTFAELCAQTALINSLATIVGRLVDRWLNGRDATPPALLPPMVEAAEAPPGAPLDALREKLSLPLRRARIIALTAEDHYLRVHTDRGAALILMSLGQAIEALGAEAGLRIHRSHWVARDAVVDSGRSQGQAAVTLANGLTLPVSRSGRRLLENARLL